MPEDKHKPILASIPSSLSGERLDKAISRLFCDYSRSYLQTLIEEGKVFVNQNCINKTKYKVLEGEIISIYPDYEREDVSWQAEQGKLNVIYEDEDIIVIDKEAGIVVHPGAGNLHGTMVNILLYRYPNLFSLPRAGIVHRLDKDTSGLMIVARNIKSHNYLVKAIQNREVKRVYEAVVNGVLISGGIIDAPIGRHPSKRTLMSVKDQGKFAITHYRIKKRFRKHTHIEVSLETGRTHQIRVHMSFRKYPIVGDKSYCRGNFIPKGASNKLANYLHDFPRQALHATMLSVKHPTTGELMTWHSSLPNDIANLIEMLKEDLMEHKT